jgi:hypothetical protein
MKATSRLVPGVLLACLLPACNNNERDNENPFAQNARTVPPPTSAALIFTTNLYALASGAGRELFAVNADGSGLVRLTFCNETSFCDYAEASPAPDRERVGARRASVDTNGDSSVNEADGAALVFVDLRRGVEALLIPASRFVSGVDWAPDSGDFFVYSALPGGGGSEDLFLVEFNGQNDRNLTCPSDAISQCVVGVRERRPRLDSLESVAAFQRVDAAGNSVIAIFSAVNNQPVITSGANDSDPVFAPDSRRVAFRRLTNASANGGLGSWDILSVAVDGTGLQVVASGPAFKGAPDWKSSGLAWTEADSSGQRLVVANADGGSPRTIVTVPAGTVLTNPRWLKAS